MTNPHDQFFRTAMADLRFARDFLNAWLPHDNASALIFLN
ncbi:TPA: Rpn family recombination-promoting nuclease/putative transposase [Legionella pneumophila]|nr:Rpn family recombination-promoting nuclease/putative transposase [Legionella pneumophila]HAT4400090.1 Rpn family recombination-promoting nuclease/putative transposase [Legionella pneumophila]HAT9877600.1 hypothetical protein [Legionella pneumophila subsp. pneumophila]HAU1802193.1 Rpn family recombination-promoting nuclease/putative transposase [Legionella pneumophila]HAV1167432.1 Rpn family recombination-promoting nuclease/putative transposase [Legionella pneumophila]